MEGLGINWKVLIGQIVNFAVLFFLLKKFVFGKFMDVLKKRQAKIEDGLKKSEEAEQNLVKIRTLEGEIRESGERKAREVLANANVQGQKQTKEIIAQAEIEKDKIITEGKKRIERELADEKQKQKNETVEMSFLLAEKFLKEKFDKEKDRKFLEDLAK
jgi:F-type H+-transporting ATPase subunit b